ncbi:MAG: SDR family oxidoreductase [Armatimonas sp.]
MKRVYIAFGVLALMLAGCGNPEAFETKQQSEEGSAVMKAQEAAAMPVGGATAASEAEAPKAPALPRKIIYTADVNLVSEDLGKTGGQIEAKVKEFSGYVSGRQIDGAAGATRTASWTVRVPAEKFEAFLAALPSMGELQSSSTTSQDVSEEFYDAAARLKNKRVEEERLVQHLKASTGRLTEILTVEKELSRVREEIERIEGRLRYLSSQADFSTITIHISEVRGYVPPSPPGLGTEIARSFIGSIDAMGVVVKGVTLAFVALLPWLVVLGGIIGGMLFAIKRLGKRDKLTGVIERWSLAGKRALVTGGTKGIGAAVADELRALGASVLTLARSDADIEADLAEPGVPTQAITQAVERLGGLDIVVNNVGTNIRKSSTEYVPAEVEKLFAVNLTSAWEVCRAAQKPLAASGAGSIANIGSVASQGFVGSGAPYAMTKAALDQLTRYLAVEWSPQIRVNAVLPWYTRTPLAAPVLADESWRGRILAATPMERIAEPEDVAAAVAFLCLPAARHITGVLLPVDGGFLARAL